MNVLIVNDTLGLSSTTDDHVIRAALALKSRGHEVDVAFQTRTSGGLSLARSLFGRTLSLDAVANDSTTGTYDALYIVRVPDEKLLSRLPSGPRVVRMVLSHSLLYPKRTDYFTERSDAAHSALLGDKKGKVSSGDSFKSSGHARKVRKLNRTVDLFLAPSEFMRRELLRNGFKPNTVSVLAPGVLLPGESALEESPLAAAGLSELFLGDEATAQAVPAMPRLLCVTELTRGRGVDSLMNALAQLKNEEWYDALSVDVVGTGPGEASLRELSVALGLDSKVLFRGAVKRDYLDRLYERCKALVIPSRYEEPNPEIALEAMAHGRPVIAYSVGAVPEWLRDRETGLLVRPGDESALAQAVSLMMLDTERANQYGRAGRELAKERFGFQRFALDLENALRPR